MERGEGGTVEDDVDDASASAMLSPAPVSLVPPFSSSSIPRTSSTSPARSGSPRTSVSSGCGWCSPEVFDPYRIEGIAHNTADFVARIEILDSLEAAVADCVFTAVLTARERAAKRRMLRPARGRRGAGGGRLPPARSPSSRAGRIAGSPTPSWISAMPWSPSRPTRPSLAQPGPGGRDHGLRDLECPGRRRPPGQATSQSGGPRHLGPAGGALHRLDPGALGHRLLQDPASGECHALLPGDRLSRRPRRREASLVRAMGIEVVRYLDRQSAEGNPDGTVERVLDLESLHRWKRRSRSLRPR